MPDFVSAVAEINCTAFEMVTPQSVPRVEIPVNTRLVERIKTRDPDARFVVVELESGFSKSRRNWKPEHLRAIADFVNSTNPVGYKGHIPPADDATAFPEIHAIWLGAKTVQTDPNKSKLYLKGYLKTQEIRDEVDMEMVNAVSPRGTVRMRPAVGGGYDVIDFECESIDFTRKSRNGLASRVVSVGEQRSADAEPSNGEVRRQSEADAETRAQRRAIRQQLVDRHRARNGAPSDVVSETDRIVVRKRKLG